MGLMYLFWQLLLMFHISCFATTSLGQSTEAQLLLKFKESLTNASRLSNWNKENTPLCNGKTPNWTGLVCQKGKFKGLKLEGMGLAGKIDVDTLSHLPSLFLLSVMNNNFQGPFPEVHKVRSLRGLYLSNNRFSGEIPEGEFGGLNGIRRVYLANNEFTGRIPTSLTELEILVELQLQNNQFVGPIPDFQQQGLELNLANNELEGPIPPHLIDKSDSDFAGNPNLCGKPLKVQCPKKKKSFPKAAIIIAAVVAFLLIIILASVVRRRRSSRNYEKASVKTSFGDDRNFSNSNSKAVAADHASSSEIYGSRGGEKGKLCFVRSDREKFELEDLLRAPAEVLGSGSFGSSYKAMLISGTVVVRRFRQMSNVGKGEFYEHMIRLGRLSHPNILPLAAFYYRKEEKLLISDFVENGSLATHLHSKRVAGQARLDWATRLKIVKGVAHGLSYLYKELSSLPLPLPLPHGHLKSSNVLLDQTFNPLLSDYALAPLFNKDHAHQFMVAYKSPEFTQHDRVSSKTDVWSLGILILELLTGRFPANYLKQGKGGNADLAAWVNSVVREEWTGEVFDKEMGGGKSGEGQMLKLLKIGMCCCEWEVGRRWDMVEALERIEELKEKDLDDDADADCSFGSDGDVFNSTIITDDDFSFSKTA